MIVQVPCGVPWFVGGNGKLVVILPESEDPIVWRLFVECFLAFEAPQPKILLTDNLCRGVVFWLGLKEPVGVPHEITLQFKVKPDPTISPALAIACAHRKSSLIVHRLDISLWHELPQSNSRLSVDVSVCRKLCEVLFHWVQSRTLCAHGEATLHICPRAWAGHVVWVRLDVAVVVIALLARATLPTAAWNLAVPALLGVAGLRIASHIVVDKPRVVEAHVSCLNHVKFIVSSPSVTVVWHLAVIWHGLHIRSEDDALIVRPFRQVIVDISREVWALCLNHGGIAAFANAFLACDPTAVIVLWWCVIDLWCVILLFLVRVLLGRGRRTSQK
mmetsp:Transcript_75764/g.149761  ORF Transcript_75764/g.149761 Transcript_75764/m.149761 type:complete len:331 (+) Transcript_75764:288-1280(+)